MTGQRPARQTILQFMHALGEAVQGARFEGDFLCAAARLLYEHISCDGIVVVRVENGEARVRATVRKGGVAGEAPEEVVEPLTRQDAQKWVLMLETAFIPDIQTTSLIKPRFKEYAERLGLQTALVVPLIEEQELLGFVAFGWTTPRTPERLDRDYIRKLLDIVSRHLSFVRIRMLQHHDPLTGLYNRLGLERHWSDGGVFPRGALLYMDLDGFKALNDAHGHAAGDEYLRRAGEELRGATPPEGSVYRLGGDEFAVLAPGIAPGDVGRLVEDIARRFERLGRSLPPPRPGITIGVVHAPDDGTELAELLDLADQRMYERKRQRAAGSFQSAAKAFTDGAAATAGKSGEAVGLYPEDDDGLTTRMFPAWLERWPDGFFIADADFKIIYTNEAFERMTGYDRTAWFGKSPAFIASGENAPRTYRAMWDGVNEQGAWSGQVVNRRPDGVEWVALMSVARLTGEDGRLVGYMGNSRDVSHSLWAGRGQSGTDTSFQEAFTQEALAFALAEAGQLHEGGSRQHLERIRDFTRLLVLGAADAGYKQLQHYETRNTMILASILHDIGKLAIPEGLLRKPGRLTREEFELVKTHTTAGEQLLRSPYFFQDAAAPESEFLTVAASIARWHHEKWDGGGYPDGLKGEEIPLGARIVGIADVYDALRSQRPYKNPWSHRETVEYIVAAAGSQFDPNLVKIFIDRALEFKAVSERALDESRERSRPGKNKTG